MRVNPSPLQSAEVTVILELPAVNWPIWVFHVPTVTFPKLSLAGETARSPAATVVVVPVLVPVVAVPVVVVPFVVFTAFMPFPLPQPVELKATNRAKPKNTRPCMRAVLLKKELFATNRGAGPDARRVLVTRQQSEFRLRELLMSATHED